VSWHVRFTSRAERDLDRLTDSDRRLILAAISAFAAGGVADVKKLRGQSLYRLRVGRWRVLYELDAGELRIAAYSIAKTRIGDSVACAT